ncbi:hypothetical protein EXA21_18115, partial [Vibrio cincinnatiensis]|nr:hypothetical protein [Vibrio cincinnatiensis]MCG3764585.1 hypothetical protein [Vibrio cincinnatiensis]
TLSRIANAVVRQQPYPNVFDLKHTSFYRKRSPRYLDLPCLKRTVWFISQRRWGTASSPQQP